MELMLLLFNLIINIYNLLGSWAFIWIALHLLTYRIIEYFIILLTLYITLVFLNLTFLSFNWTFIVWIHKKLTIFLKALIYFIFIIIQILRIMAYRYRYISIAMNYDVSKLIVYLLHISLGSYFFYRLFFLNIL